MGKLHQRKQGLLVRSILARIKGEKVPWAEDMPPVHDEPVPEPNRSILLRFYETLAAEELSIGRTAVLLGNMYRVSIWLGHRPFREITKEDTVELVQRIKSAKGKRRTRAVLNAGYAERTIEGYKCSIKKFWKWLKPQDDPNSFPPEVRWIKLKRVKNNLRPSDIWSPEEVNKLAQVAGSSRNRAFVLGLFGSGCRIEEFLTIRRKDVVFDNYGCRVFVEGKTGPRTVRLTPAASVALAAWLDDHPLKESEAPVWINTHLRQIPNRWLGYDWAHRLLKRLARRAGIDKPIRPHLLRHSLATYYAPLMTDSVRNMHFGWVQGSRMPEVYTHLSGCRVDDQLLAVFGMKKVDPETNKALDVTHCLRCRTENTPSSTQCCRCGFPLSDEAAWKIHERRETADALMDIITSHPEMQQLLRRIIAKEAQRRPELLRDVPHGHAGKHPSRNTQR